ncbi:hypothetical protein D3C77_258310 [compost metagenome]
MQGRDAQPLDQRQRALQQGLARGARIRAGGVEEARPRDGREGHGAQQLGIIAPARTLIGVGPGVVEDVFALAVPLQIERHDADHGAVFIVQGQMARRPALKRDGAAGRLASVEEVVGDEGIAARGRAGVPRVPAYRGDAVVHL